VKYSAFQATRQGGRDLNEDRFVHTQTERAGLFVVADGMGGHPEGEIAAQIAVDTMASVFNKTAQPVLADPRQFLTDALLLAHQTIIRYAIQKKLKDCPRTTVVAALVQDAQAHWIHCGDSRLYITQGGKLLTRTRDHSYLEQKNAGVIRTGVVNRNILFSCLGSPTKPIYDQGGPAPLRAGDRLLLCSDGLWDNLDDASIVSELLRQPVAQSVPLMVERALSAGGERCDNVTVVGVEWEEDISEAQTVAMPLPRRRSPRYETTIQAGALNPGEGTLDEAEIERSIAEINEAIKQAAARKA
jgi:serine/threonine protein phosphatase PrpC